MKPNHVKILCEHYFENMTFTMKNMLQDELLTDVTFCCKEGSVKAHKLILASVSPYLRKIFLNNPGSQISLVLFGVNVSDVRHLIELIYKGSLELPSETASSIYNLAGQLDISGLNIDDGVKVKDTVDAKPRKKVEKGTRLKKRIHVTADFDMLNSEEDIIVIEQDSMDRRISTSSEKSENAIVDEVKVPKLARGISDISVVVPRMDLDEAARQNVFLLKERKYKCKDCPAGFKRASHLSRHKLVHTGERPYLCEYCDKAYSRHDKLKNHLRTTHGVMDDLSQLNAELPSDSLYTIGHVQILSPEHEVTDPSAPIRHEDLPPPSEFTNCERPTRVKKEVLHQMPDISLPQKRGRGRPRKHPPSLKPSLKRPRGRPRMKPIDPHAKKRPRGRPRVKGTLARQISVLPSQPPRMKRVVVDSPCPVAENQEPMIDNNCFMMEPLVEIKTEIEPDIADSQNDHFPVLPEENSFLTTVGLMKIGQ